VGGVEELAYSRSGSGIPFVFLHGLGASREQAAATIADVDGVERIVIDAPAHGGSARSSVALEFGAFAREMVAVLDRLGVGAAIVGGISMGSGIALRMARDFPDRVMSLVLVRPAWLDRPGRPHLDLVSDIGRWVAADGSDVARKRLLDDERYAAITAVAPMAAASVVKAIDTLEFTGRPDVLTAMVDSAPLDDLVELGAVTQPALVVSTEHDPLHPCYIADTLTTVLPNAEGVLAPPRYLEPDSHQSALTAAISSFVAHHHGEVELIGER